MTSTEAQNAFGSILDVVAQDRVVVVTKRNRPHAVIISVQRYDELTGAGTTELDALAAEFDEMLERMQTAESAKAMKKAFAASPAELGKAAVVAAKRRKA